MMKTVVLALMVVCAASAVQAADPVPSSTAAPGASAAAEGMGDRYDLATKIVNAQVTDEMRKKSTETLPLMITPLVVRDNPGQEAKISQIMQSSVVPVLASLTDDNMRRAAEELAKNFTVDELKQIYAFQSSPIGQKYSKYNLEQAAKLKDITKAQSTLKMQEAVRALVAQLRANNLQVPKELGAP